jgi:hypothetical protein
MCAPLAAVVRGSGAHHLMHRARDARLGLNAPNEPIERAPEVA